MRGIASHDRVVAAGAALFFVMHLVWLPRHLEDIDSINFALGLRDYDVASHQPHPPGYPVFILLARAVAALLAPWLHDAPTRAAVAMSVLAALTATIALLALYKLLTQLESSSRVAAVEPVAPAQASSATVTRTAWPLLAVAATASAPLFWITAARPLSDASGLAGALMGQWLIVRAARAGAPLRDALAAAVVCGLAVGLRSQVTWLVVPLLIWLLSVMWRRAGARPAVGVGAAALAGVLLWAVPMVAISGGPDAYRAALTSQAGEDLEGVPMLALRPSPRQAVTAIVDTMVSPWGVWPLAIAVSILAAIGALSLRRSRAYARWVLLGALPYAIYHFLFQETETTRYALPLVPVIAVLAMLAARRWPRVLGPALVVVCVAAFGVSVLAHRQYVTAGVTIQETLRDMEARAQETPARPQVLMHRRVWAETRRARAALASHPAYDILPAPRALEWRGALGVWSDAGDQRAVWWLADPRRGDRAAVDPHAFAGHTRLAWPSPVSALLGGMRPHPFEWHVMRRPSWVLEDGWSLTPELAGLSAAAGQGPSTTGASARLHGPAAETTVGSYTLLVGGRHVAPAGAAPIRLAVEIGDTAGGWREEIDIPAGPFVHTWTVSAGVVVGSAPLSVRVRGQQATPETVFLEQFDWQPTDRPVTALEAGWYEPERDPASGRQWRWVADRSTLRVQPTDRDVRIEITGTYPRHYARAPVLELRLGDTVLGRHTLSRPFRVSQQVSAQQLATVSGRLTWRVSESFVAGERTGTADARRLALEISALRVEAVR